MQECSWMRRRVGDILEGDLAFNLLAGEHGLLRPLHEDPDVRQWCRHSAKSKLKAPSARRRSVLSLMDAATIELGCANSPA